MSKRMNVLHIMADQHHAGCMGHEGHPQVISPNLDRLAASGLRFTRCYAQNTICTPSRVSLISGQYCHNHGFYGLGGPRPDWLPGSFSHFKQHGYRTAGIGKLHLPTTPRIWLETQFDTCADSYFGMDGNQETAPWCMEIKAKGLQDKHEFYQSNVWGEPKQRASEIPFDMSQEGWSVREAIRFMDGCGDAPFCMQVSFERPHDPCVPAREFWDMYPDDIELPKSFTYPCDHRPPHFREMHASWRKEAGADYVAAAKRRWKGYLASITHTDHAVGRLLDHLDKSGLAENTIVIYNADHGAYMSQYGIYEKAPGICSEAVCRVPSIWRVPGVTPAGQACGQLTENVDMAPTMATLCGLPAMPWADGLDITSLLAGGNRPVRELAVTECPHSKAIRWGKWRFVHYQPETFGEDVGELYDSEADPEETRNLYHAPEHRETVEQCRRQLLEWLIRTTRIRTGWGVHGVDHKNKLYPDAGDGRMPLPQFGSCRNYE